MTQLKRAYGEWQKRKASKG